MYLILYQTHCTVMKLYRTSFNTCSQNKATATRAENYMYIAKESNTQVYLLSGSVRSVDSAHSFNSEDRRLLRPPSLSPASFKVLRTASSITLSPSTFISIFEMAPNQETKEYIRKMFKVAKINGCRLNIQALRISYLEKSNTYEVIRQREIVSKPEQSNY